VAFGGKVDKGVNLMLVQDAFDQAAITDVAADKV